MATEFARLLNVEEVAELLGMSASWVRKQTADPTNPLPSVRLGTGQKASRRYRIRDIEDWLNAQQQKENADK